MITTIFDPPLPTDPLEVFNTKSFDTASKYNAFGSEINATAAAVNTDATNAATSAATATTKAAEAVVSELAAEASAQTAAANAGASAWNAAMNYGVGTRVWSLLNAQLFRRIVAGVSATDPALDQTNWARVWVEPEMVTAESFYF